MPARKTPARPKKPVMTDDEAIKRLQALGFTITPPSGEEDRAKQSRSAATLGLKSARKPKEPEPEADLVYTLHFQHHIGGAVYGPGQVTLPRTQDAIFRQLVYQDQYSTAHHFDTADRNPYTKSFMISPSGRNHYLKVPVTEAQIDQMEFTTLAVGKVDAAGYNPAPTNYDGSF